MSDHSSDRSHDLEWQESSTTIVEHNNPIDALQWSLTTGPLAREFDLARPRAIHEGIHLIYTTLIDTYDQLTQDRISIERPYRMIARTATMYMGPNTSRSAQALLSIVNQGCWLTAWCSAHALRQVELTPKGGCWAVAQAAVGVATLYVGQASSIVLDEWRVITIHSHGASGGIEMMTELSELAAECVAAYIIDRQSP